MRPAVLLALFLIGCARDPSSVRIEIAVAGDASGIRWLQPTIGLPLRALAPLPVEPGELPGAVVITDLDPAVRRLSIFFEARSGDGRALFTGATCAAVDGGSSSLGWVVLQAGFTPPHDGCADADPASDLGARLDLAPALDQASPPDLSRAADLEPPRDLASSSAATFPFSTSFEGPDGSDWPPAFVPLGSGVAAHDVMGGRGRLVSVTDQFASMNVPALRSRDFAVTTTIALDDPAHQGVGAVVRSDGRPAGNGYGWFLHPILPESFELWRSLDGGVAIVATAPSPVAVTAGVPLRVRFEVIQSGAMTILRAKLWRADLPEPAAWTMEVIDSTPELQDQIGSPSLLAIDYPGIASGVDHVHFDDVSIGQP